jgi:hypothetical protein
MPEYFLPWHNKIKKKPGTFAGTTKTKKDR